MQAYRAVGAFPSDVKYNAISSRAAVPGNRDGFLRCCFINVRRGLEVVCSDFGKMFKCADREDREWQQRIGRVKPSQIRKLVRFGQAWLAGEIACDVDHGDPVLCVFREDLFSRAEKLNFADRQAGFFLGLTTCRIRGRLHLIDLAADDVPVTGFRRLQATAEENPPIIPQNDQPGADAGKVYAGSQGQIQTLALATISMNAGMSSPKPTGVGPSSWSR